MKKALIIILLAGLAVGVSGQGFNYMSTDHGSRAMGVSLGSQSGDTCNLDFTWQQGTPPQVTKFQLYLIVAGTSQDTISCLVDSIPGASRAYTLTWYADGMEYYFGLRACNDAGNSTFTTIAVTMPDNRKPAEPTNFQGIVRCN